MVGSLVAVSSGVVFGANNETASLGCAAVHCLDEINHFLLAVDGPVDFVIITCAKIDHNMLVPVEKHNSARIIELVHLVKVGHLSRVDQVHDGKVLTRSDTPKSVSSITIQVSSQSCPNRRTTTRSSSDKMA